MKEGNSKKTIVIGSILFAVVVIGMLALLFAKCDFNTIFKTIAGANKVYLVIAVGLIGCFITCEGVNISRVLKSLGYEITIWQIIKYSACGFFFSDITPSASGGQPMQLFFMHRDKIHLSHGTIALLADTLGYQVANCTLGIIGLLYNLNLVLGLSVPVKVVLGAGIVVNLTALILLVLAMFSPKSVSLAKGFANKVIRKEKTRDKIEHQINEYQESSEYLKGHKRVLYKNILTSFIQMIATYSITYCVYLALGLQGHGWLDVLTIQALLSAGVSAIPLPGTVGAGEGGFKLLFGNIFIGSALVPGMILSRGLSLYMGLIMTGLILTFTVVMKRLQCYNTGR